MTEKKKHNLLLLNLAIFLLNQTYIAPISLLFYLHNDLTLVEFVFFQSIYSLTCVLMEIPAGYFGDIFPKKYILIFAHFLLLLKVFLWFNFSGYAIILAGEILFALSKSFSRGVAEGYISDLLKLDNTHEQLMKKCGHYNFSMSFGTALSALVGAYLYKFLGFKTLLASEFTFILISIICLLCLTKIPVTKINSLTFKSHLSRILSITKATYTNIKINGNIFYTAVLTSLSSAFVWTFQPSMLKVHIPIIFFGIISCSNHAIRALCSMFSQNIIKKLSVRWFNRLTFATSVCSIIAIIACQHISNKIICVILLLGICLAIGINLIYNIYTVSRIINNVEGLTKSTSASVSTMTSCMMTAILLYLYKYSIQYISISKFFAVLLVCYVIIFLLLKKRIIPTNEN